MKYSGYFCWIIKNLNLISEVKKKKKTKSHLEIWKPDDFAGRALELI